MKLVVNILDNELCSSKAGINFNRNKIGHFVKLMFFLKNELFQKYFSKTLDHRLNSATLQNSYF